MRRNGKLNNVIAKVIPTMVLGLGLAASGSPAHAACTNPAATEGKIIYNKDYSVFQGCTTSGWQAFHAPQCPTGDSCAADLCAGTPSPGDICADGTVYAGTSPDGSVPMYTTPADAGQMSWNKGTANWIDLAGMTNCTDVTPGSASSCQTGEANTTLLVGLSDAASPYIAARYCHCLGKPATGTCSSDPTGGANGYGHTDWYLPAQDELDVLYDSKAAIGGFNISGSFPAGYYWSSSEGDNVSARLQRFSDGIQGNLNKSSGLSVRCVRR